MAEQKSPPDEVEEKEEMVRVRAPASLMDKVRQKLDERGGWSLSSVTRALWEAWVDEDFVTAKDVAKHSKSAPKKRKKKDQSSKK